MSNRPIVSRLVKNVRWKAWLKPFIIHPSITAGFSTNFEKKKSRQDVSPYVHPAHIFQGAFLKTYTFDGYEIASTEATTAQGQKLSFSDEAGSDSKSQRCNYPELHVDHALFTFLGFPTRLQTNEDNKVVVDWRAIGKNMVGGWDSLNNGQSNSSYWWLNWNNYTFKGKRVWNIFLLPVKLLIIFPLKVIEILVKFPVNIIKLFTEFFPEVILNYSGLTLGSLSAQLHNLYSSNSPWYSKILKEISLIFICAILIVIHYPARAWALLGTTLTSPEKSAKMAFNYGLALNSPFRYIFSTAGAAISIILTAILWTFSILIIMNFGPIFFPGLTSLILGTTKNPFINRILAQINNIASFIATAFPTTINRIAFILEKIFNINFALQTVAFGVTVAFISAPLIAIGSRIMHELSNLWARWSANKSLGQFEIDVFGIQIIIVAATTFMIAALGLLISFIASPILGVGSLISGLSGFFAASGSVAAEIGKGAVVGASSTAIVEGGKKVIEEVAGDDDKKKASRRKRNGRVPRSAKKSRSASKS